MLEESKKIRSNGLDIGNYSTLCGLDIGNYSTLCVYLNVNTSGNDKH
jgi:hypothetical protein